MDSELVSVNKVVARFDIPKATVYHLVDTGYVRAHLQPRKAHHQRRRLLFNLEEVAADLARLPKPKA